MANGSNNENFKNKLTKELKEKIQKSVRDSFEKNIKGKGKTENAGIRDFEESADERRNRYEDIKRNTGSGFAGGVAGREEKEGKNRYESIKKNAMGGFAGGVSGQTEMRRIKKNIEENRKNVEKSVKETKKNVRKYSAKINKARKKIAQLKKAAAIEAKKSKAPGGFVIILTVITFILACLVDIVDVVGELGVELGTVPTIMAFIINFISSIIITITWQMIFSGSKGKNKKQTKMIIRSILILFGVENIPIIELLPFNAIAVVWNYLDFKKGQKSD